MSRLGGVGAVLAFAALLAPFAGPAVAEETAKAFDAEVASWSRVLDRVDGLDERAPALAEIDAAYAETLRVQEQAAAMRGRIEVKLEPLREEIAALGPRPGDGEPAEAADVIALRTRLEKRAAAIDARLKHADVVIARAAGLQRELRQLRRGRLAGRLLTRGPPPLDPATWAPAAASLRAIATAASGELRAWWTAGPPARSGAPPFLWVAAIVLVAVLASWPVSRWLIRNFGRDAESAEPDAARRLVAAAAEGVGRALVVCLPVVALAGTLIDLDLVTGRAAFVAGAAARAILLLVLAATFGRVALPPDAPGWRLVPLGDEAARAARRRVDLLAIFLASAAFLRHATRELPAPAPELESLVAIAIALPLAIILMPLSARRVWRAEGLEGERSRTGALLHLVVAVVVIAMPLAALAGWSRLAYEINRMVLAGVVVAVIFVAVRTVIVALLVFATAPAGAAPESGRPGGADEGPAFWLRLAADLVLFPAAVCLWLVLLGVPWRLLVAATVSALQTIEIGGHRLSLSDLVFALVFFAAILAVTRLLHRTLEQRILPRTDLTPGTRQALTAAISYLGLALAIAVAVSALGLDLSNLALIAGALSVGIGFGLQNVVNNFVCGVILLVERPVQVGDWVVIGTHEGTVKRINVRATEIETFQRSAVIIPNSEVLSSAVVNWTHRDKYGRLDLAVGVAYGSDVDRVREVLLACARAHPRVVTIPPPYVLFRDFGDSALQFELRAYLANVEERLTVMSDLRFAIDAAFRRSGIEIPFAQHDLRLRDIDRLERALAGRRDGAAAVPGENAGGESHQGPRSDAAPGERLQPPPRSLAPRGRSETEPNDDR